MSTWFCINRPAAASWSGRLAAKLTIHWRVQVMWSSHSLRMSTRSCVGSMEVPAADTGAAITLDKAADARHHRRVLEKLLVMALYPFRPAPDRGYRAEQLVSYMVDLWARVGPSVAPSSSPGSSSPISTVASL